MSPTITPISSPVFFILLNSARLVFKETLVLHWWGSETKLILITKGNLATVKKFQVLTFHVLALRQHESAVMNLGICFDVGLKRETSAFQSH